MKIKELIKILNSSHDKERGVCIPSIESEKTMNVWHNFDDFWNIELYEIAQ